MLAAEPEMNRVDTENAEQNGPMVAVNVQLGFEVIERVQEYQRDVWGGTHHRGGSTTSW